MIQFDAPFKEWLDAWVVDFKIFFTRWDIMKKERHDLHFFVSGIISLIITMINYGFHFFQFDSIGLIPICFIMSFSLFFLNLVREQYIQSTSGKDKNGNYNAPFDWRDVRMGGYGGFCGAILGYYLSVFITMILP